jgi:dienelactone hydrolase
MKALSLPAALLLLASAIVNGQGALEGREFAAAANLPKSNAKVEGLLFLPHEAKRVSRVVVILDYGQLGRLLFEDDALRRVVKETSGAVVLARFTHIEPPPPDEPVASQLLRNAAVGGGDALLLLLRQFAEETGHRELRDASMLFWGWSAAASFGTTFAASQPERTVGFIRYHAHRRGLSDDAQRLKQIPALLIAGGKDETAGVEDAQAFWKLGRAAGAPWALVVEPGSPHFSLESHALTAKQLVIPWIAAVLRSGLARDGAWLANTDASIIASDGGFAGDKAAANWLPDEVSARGVHAVMHAVVRPDDGVSGTWTGEGANAGGRLPLFLELKVDGATVTSAVLNAGGMVGETRNGKFDPVNGTLSLEIDAKAPNNPALAMHFVLHGVVFANTATGRIDATAQTGVTVPSGRFLITRK